MRYKMTDSNKHHEFVDKLAELAKLLLDLKGKK